MLNRSQTYTTTRRGASFAVAKVLLLVVMMSHTSLISLLSRGGGGRRLVAQAFQSTAFKTTSARTLSSSSTSTSQHFGALTTVPSHRFCLFSTSSSQRSASTTSEASVEEGLDAALEDILGDALKEAENPLDMSSGNHMKGSRPMPAMFVEQDEILDNDNVSLDEKNPNFLSTSNPHWIKRGRLDARLIDVLSHHKGITHFTPVQAKAMDPILARRDVIGRSRTGTGKTLAFGLPSLMRLVDFTTQKGTRDAVSGRMARGRSPSMLVLCPTRELARQVQEELAQVAQPLGLFAEVFHGGVSYDPQANALRQGVDIIVGTPGRIMDHMNRGNLKLDACEIVVLDEADEMLNMGFAEDVEVILQGVGSANPEKTQCLMFSATTPPWVKEIGRKYQKDVLSIDSTSDEGGARTASTVRHLAVQLPPGTDAKKAILEDIIAVEISRDAHLFDSSKSRSSSDESNSDESDYSNPLAAAHAAKKRKSAHAMQQQIFGKTIVFTQTKREADELVSGNIFKSLTAQALHGDVGQKQRDATLNAFRAGAFNVLVATDVAARGIDIQDVDLVVQFDPPRDVDSYVHRSGRTGRAGKRGVSVLLFNPRQARDIVKIERDLGHGFKFDLVGPPSTEAALKAAARTSAIASKGIPDETAQFFKETAAALLADGEDPEDVVARCLAAISRRSTEVQSRSLITGELGMATVEMVNTQGRSVAANDVMFTVSKLSRLSRRDGALSFDSDVGRIQQNLETGTAIFDMSMEDAKKLVAFSGDIDAGGAVFSLLKEMEVERGRSFGQDMGRSGGGGGGGGRGGAFQREGYRGGGGGDGRFNNNKGGEYRRGERTSSNYHGQNRRANQEGRQGSRYQEGRFGNQEGRQSQNSSGGYQGRYDSRNSNTRNNDNSGW